MVGHRSRPARPVGAPLTGPTGYVYSVTFSPDGKTLAAGVTDGTVWLWNLAVPAHPGPDRDPHRTATGMCSPSPSLRPAGPLAAASADGTVRLWDTSPAAAVAAVCADAGQPLTRLEWDTYITGVTYRAPC